MQPVEQHSPFAGLTASVTTPGADAVGYATSTVSYNKYDNMGRLLQSASPPNNNGSANNNFDSTYDAAGNLASQDDGGQIPSANHQTGYDYDQLGRKKKLTYPDGTTEKWTYDASGNVATYTNRATSVCTYLYDGRNRCTQLSWSGGSAPTVNYEYDVAGHVTRVNNGYSDLHFTYDDSGAVLTEQALRYGQSITRVTTYTHDIDGHVDSILYPHGDRPWYTYDNQGRCTQVILNGQTLCGQYNYRPGTNWLNSCCLPYCGVDTAYEYQSNGRVSYLWHYKGDYAGNGVANGSIRLQFYGYAPDGQVSWTYRSPGGDQSGNNSALDRSGQGDAYYYYQDGSLSTAFRNVQVNGGWPAQQSPNQDARVNTDNLVFDQGALPSPWERYYFDAAGNRTQVLASAYTLPYPGVDGANRYLPATNYDANGNTVDTGQGWHYTYNANDQLTSAVNSTTGQAMYFDYDGLGRMSAENVNGVLKIYYYAGSQRIEERDNAKGDPLFQYYFDSPTSDQILFRNDQTTYGLVWYLHDQLGNTTHLCDSGGNVLEAYLYDAFGTPTVYDKYGNVRTGGTTWDNRYLLKGAGAYQWYAPAGIYYARARFYMPSLGRWLQPDPIGQAGGLNIYAYCGNDPVNGIDPSGLAEDNTQYYEHPPGTLSFGGSDPNALSDGSDSLTQKLLNGEPPDSVAEPSPLGTVPMVGAAPSSRGDPVFTGSGSLEQAPSSESNSASSQPLGFNPLSSSSTPGRQSAGINNRYDGLLPGSKLYIGRSSHQVFWAPPNADFYRVRNAAFATNGNPLIIKSDVSFFGTYDFQRNLGLGRLSRNTFFGQYTKASNYAIGVYMHGTGYVWPFANLTVHSFAATMSSNGDPRINQEMRSAGWDDAEDPEPAILIYQLPR